MEQLCQCPLQQSIFKNVICVGWWIYLFPNIPTIIVNFFHEDPAGIFSFIFCWTFQWTTDVFNKGRVLDKQERERERERVLATVEKSGQCWMRFLVSKYNSWFTFLYSYSICLTLFHTTHARTHARTHTLSLSLSLTHTLSNLVQRDDAIFLKWQPCHFPVMVFWLLWAIYLGFSQYLLWFMLVFLTPISIYNSFLLVMAQLCVSTNLESILFCVHPAVVAWR